MLGKLVSRLKRQTISDKSAEDEPPLQPVEVEKPMLGLRKSARLSAQKSSLHDSGTESDDEELERLEKEKVCDELAKNYGDFLNSRSPPAFLSSPPLKSEFETESWDSTGGESGIIAGFESNECSRDSADCPTPPLPEIPRGAFHRTNNLSAMCEFPPMSMHNTGEKRRHSMTQGIDLPIAARLRSAIDGPREIIVAARRTPVRVLVNRQNPTPINGTSPPKSVPIIGRKLTEADLDGLSPPGHSMAKRGRTNCYGRPTLDLDKMLEHRLSSSGMDGLFLENDAWKGFDAPGSFPDCHFRPVEIDS